MIRVIHLAMTSWAAGVVLWMSLRRGGDSRANVIALRKLSVGSLPVSSSWRRLLAARLTAASCETRWTRREHSHTESAGVRPVPVCLSPVCLYLSVCHLSYCHLSVSLSPVWRSVPASGASAVRQWPRPHRYGGQTGVWASVGSLPVSFGKLPVWPP